MHRGPEHGPAGMSAGWTTVTELLVREGRTEEPAASGRSGGTYRVLAVAAGAALACAVITASTAALAGPRVERALPATGVPEHITGPGVLRPDLINTTIDPTTGTQQDRTPPEPAGTSAAPPETTGPPSTHAERSLPTDSGDPAGGGSDVAGAGEPVDDDVTADTGERADLSAEPAPDRLVRIVTSFYEQVVTAPADAYALLGSGMRGSGYRAFAESWDDVERVTVDSIHRDGPGAAIVTVVVERADGSVLRSVQRVVVASGSPRIESARLLSASTS